MRIWDIHPGYLNRQSLLGEHRELHGIVSIILNGKKGYSKHPETVRWLDCHWALRMRHQLLATEMKLRGYTDRSPVDLSEAPNCWPPEFIDSPFQQIQIIREKYKDKSPGRIPLPNTAQDIWRQHKYSVMARDITAYKEIGRKISSLPPDVDFSDLAKDLIMILRKQPSQGGIRNSLLHMWGYVSKHAPAEMKKGVETLSSIDVLENIQTLAFQHEVEYLKMSTALSELAPWIE